MPFYPLIPDWSRFYPLIPNWSQFMPFYPLHPQLVTILTTSSLILFTSSPIGPLHPHWSQFVFSSSPLATFLSTSFPLVVIFIFLHPSCHNFVFLFIPDWSLFIPVGQCSLHPRFYATSSLIGHDSVLFVPVSQNFIFLFSYPCWSQFYAFLSTSSLIGHNFLSNCLSFTLIGHDSSVVNLSSSSRSSTPIIAGFTLEYAEKHCATCQHQA